MDVKNEEPKKRINQWSRNDNTFKFIGDTVDFLKPGFYKTTTDMSGDQIFSLENTQTENLMQLDDGNANEIITDIYNFWNKEKEYKNFATQYKRGILLSGPPGTGKTCIIKLIINDTIKRNGICIQVDSRYPELFSSAHNIIRQVYPDTPLMGIIEDIRDHDIDSDFLNMIDGMVPLHKTVIIATTNYPNELPDTIVNRPGRFDNHYNISYPSESARKLLICNIIPDNLIDEVDIDKYVKDSHGFSMGHIKELVMATMLMNKNYDETILRLKTMPEGITD